MPGTIWPRRQWQVVGASRRHLLELDCGRFGLGPMHASVDGARVLTFSKPSLQQPSVLAPALALDGRQIVVYADTRDRGAIVGCDVFADGFSLHNGAAIESLVKRRATTAAASVAFVPVTEPGRFVAEFLDAAPWMLAGATTGVFALQLPHHTIGTIALWYGLYVLASSLLAFVGKRVVRSLPSRRPGRRRRATAVLLGWSGSVFGLLIWIHFVGPLAVPG